jgi:hypothetical protein
VRRLVSAPGYERQRLAEKANRCFTHAFRLKPSSAELAGVEVVGRREEKVAESTRMGTLNIPVSQIKLLPALFGETDVLKALQLLPGAGRRRRQQRPLRARRLAHLQRLAPVRLFLGVQRRRHQERGADKGRVSGAIRRPAIVDGGHCHEGGQRAEATTSTTSTTSRTGSWASATASA